MFSSLDFEFVTFFRDRKPQISQYSGENVHILGVPVVAVAPKVIGPQRVEACCG